VPILPHNPCYVNNATSAQKGKDKKKAKYDSLQELRKNKKELEFEQKLYKEKEEMLEKEKQLKINRLAQEVCVLLTGQVSTLGHSLVVPHQAARGPAGVVLHRWSLRTGPAPLPSLESETISPARAF
jgi:uncharacterized protein (DUF3084 family)